MLRNILIKCAQLILRDDILAFLKSNRPIEGNDNVEDNLCNEPLRQIAEDVNRLISFYNFSVNAISEIYLPCTRQEKVTSDSEKKIFYFYLSSEPTKIASVKDENNRDVHFDAKTRFVLVPEAFKTYEVTYNFTPAAVKDLDAPVYLPNGISEQAICYAVASEFLASKNEIEKSKFYKDKFTDTLFLSKNKKERRVKSTFLR